MPTGYTEAVQTGKITDLKQFALHCAKAYLPEMRDGGSHVVDRIEPDLFDINENIVEANDKLIKLTAMTEAQCYEEAAKDFERLRIEWLERREQRLVHRVRYTTMLKMVEAWEPPEVMQSLKKFMMQQLSTSIEWDCGDRYDSPPALQTGPEWKVAQMKMVTQTFEFYMKLRREEIERTEKRNQWVKTLLEAFGD